jgi:hypothetical protein
MNTLAEIEQITDLDSRLIRAAGLMEAELRTKRRQQGADGDWTLRELVYQEPALKKAGFVERVSVALQVHDAICHPYEKQPPSTTEQADAAATLIAAIAVLGGGTGKKLGPVVRGRSGGTSVKSSASTKSRPVEQSSEGGSFLQAVQVGGLLLYMAGVLVMGVILFSWTHGWIGDNSAPPVLIPITDPQPPLPPPPPRPGPSKPTVGPLDIPEAKGWRTGPVFHEGSVSPDGDPPGR